MDKHKEEDGHEDQHGTPSYSDTRTWVWMGHEMLYLMLDLDSSRHCIMESEA
jgi:hypothetical protein